MIKLSQSSNIPCVVSGTRDGNKDTKAVYCNGSVVQEISQLAASIEEADLRIIIHIHFSLWYEKRTKLLILSNDTDVLALLLY